MIFNVGADHLRRRHRPSTKWGIFGRPEWIGFRNFTDSFKDVWVGIAFRNTLLYALIIVPGVVILGLIFALYVNRRWPLSSLVRTLFFSPNVVSSTVIGLVWVWLLDTQFGLINHYLGMLGIPNIPWLTSTQWSLIGVSIASIWWDLEPGLRAVPWSRCRICPRRTTLCEAAEIDGVNAWQRLRLP